MPSLLVLVIVAALISFALSSTIAVGARWVVPSSIDHPVTIQAFHHVPTPRIGGIAIVAGMLAVQPLVSDPGALRIIDTLLIAGAPALAFGLLEDFTRSVSVTLRLAATLASGALACGVGGYAVTHLDLPLLDEALAWQPLAILFTAFAVAGVTNAVNIIDGFHGLASGATTISLVALTAIASVVGDTSLVIAALVVIAAMAGFWLINFPWGKLFLGDGGAYFVGFALAWIAVLLPMRNPIVSPWASLLVCGYPVIEVLYSVFRRWHHGQSPGQPDRGHLHSLVARRIVQRRLRGVDPTLQNSAVSVVMWMCAAIPASLGVTFYRDTPWLALGALGCIVLYHWLYRQLARP